jgi:hypothetical protein
MDLLYSKYSNPLEFMRLYIGQGRFGEFVENILLIENKKRKEEAEKENEDKMFELYVHSYSDKSFNDWKKEALSTPSEKKSLSMTDYEVEEAKNRSRNILKGFKLK